MIKPINFYVNKAQEILPFNTTAMNKDQVAYMHDTLQLHTGSLLAWIAVEAHEQLSTDPNISSVEFAANMANSIQSDMTDYVFSNVDCVYPDLTNEALEDKTDEILTQMDAIDFYGGIEAYSGQVYEVYKNQLLIPIQYGLIKRGYCPDQIGDFKFVENNTSVVQILPYNK
jgi:hypothetical protein